MIIGIFKFSSKGGEGGGGGGLLDQYLCRWAAEGLKPWPCLGQKKFSQFREYPCLRDFLILTVNNAVMVL